MSSKTKTLLAVIVALVIAIMGYLALTQPDRRSPGQKIGDAIDTLPQGVDKAVRQLENRTPGEKLGDAVKDAGDTIKSSTDR